MAVKHKKVTLEVVAREAGVSRATVSLVVRKSPLVAEHTRKKVEKIMADLDYVRDIGAARMRNNSSRTIGVIVPNLVNPFFTELLSGVEQMMGADDRVVLLANSHDDPMVQGRILQRFRSHGVDGVILCPAEGTDPELLQRMQKWNMPIVQALREVGSNVTDYAGADFIKGVRLAIQHLVEIGHRRIAFLSVFARTSVREERLQGFSRAIAEYGATDAGIVEAELSWKGAAQSARKFLELKEPPSAVLCFNDVLAAGLMLGLRREGCEPGRDMAVVGIDNLQMAELTYPTMTSVAVAPKEIGINAGRLLADRIRNPEAPVERYIVVPTLIIRNSSNYHHKA